MKIAFIRGPFLNPWELQTYLPLVQRHLFKAIGADWQVYSQTLDQFKGPVLRAHLWASSTATLHPGLPVFLNRLRSWTLGESYGLRGLDDIVKDCDILHPAETHSTMTHQCLQLRRQGKFKVVATVWENLPGMGELHPRRRARKLRALRELDGFLAVTETSRNMLIKEGAPADRIETIPMAVDLQRFSPAPKQNVKKTILFIGRWVEEKGIGDILQAIPDVLKKASCPVQFCFVGAGPLEAQLRRAAIDYPENIQLIPFASYEDLPRLHNMADIFLLPSKPTPKWEEQFGYVLVESMACGKAIITTRSGSIPDVVGKAAVLIPPGDPSAISSALIQLLNSDAERARLGQAARRWAEAHFDVNKIAPQIESFYERALKR